MAPRYSKKKAKYTYTERVLGALSDIQKDHRKHAVHMATLRAHIRKAADARKDRLGPQWSQWVSRTVQRLTNDGILDTSDPHGNVTFTPDAKKTITTVRRESLAGTNASPAVEHKVWKDVTRRFSTIGVKRPRRSSDISSINDRSRKRRVRESFSGFTKAELEMELKAALHKLDEAEEQQAADAQDELDELREEVMRREAEVEQLRDEVVRLQDHHPDAQYINIETSTRFLTPPPTNGSEMATPSTGRTVGAPRRQLSTHGMTRTLSGSLISNLTKRPTPEPSESGSHDAEIENMFVVDVHQRPLSPPNPSNLDVDVMFNPGLETPQSSPMYAERVLDVESDARHEHNDKSAEIVSLKNELETQGSLLRELREERVQLLAERNELRASVAFRDDRVTSLEAELRSRVDALAADEICIADLETEKARLQRVEVDMQEARTALGLERERYSCLEGKHCSLRDMVNHLQSKVDYLTLHSRSLQSNLEDAHAMDAVRRLANHQSEAQLRKAKMENDSLKKELCSTQDSASALQQELQQSKTRDELVNADLARTKSELVSVQEELGEAQRTIVAGNAAQSTMSSQITELKADLDSAGDQVTVLTTSNGTLQRSIVELQENLAAVGEELSHANDEVASTTAELEKSLDALKALRMSHAQAVSEASAATREAAALKAIVSELQLTSDRLHSQLEHSAAESADVRVQLATEETFRRSAESQLVATGEERDRLLADIADKTALFATTMEELQQARQACDDARRQIASLQALHESDVAVHLAERSALESRLETSRAEAAGLKTKVEGLSSELLTLSTKLSSLVVEKNELESAVKRQTARSARLEEQLSVALGDVRDAEEEIEELRQAKMADEASIQSLKDLLARLRQVQLDAVEEVNNKMISAQTAPTPDHRRRSSIASRQSVVQKNA